MTVEDLRNFLRELEDGLPEEPPDYSLGYIDALQYVIEWMEEDV